MTLRHPVQKLCLLPSTDHDLQLLLAASGPTISVVCFANGKLQYQWPSRYENSDSDETADDDRPKKKRKVDSNGPQAVSRQHSEASDASLEIVAERKKGERKKSKIIDTKLPNVSHLLATSDGKYVVAVTAEDKAIRVFAVSTVGKLSQLSQRSLPKKLCALSFTRDEKTILAADKFGDVYAIPIHQTEGWAQKVTKRETTTFKPSASELTVHTKTNLVALRQQQEQKTNAQKKEGPDFEHQLLLGHVSLLTDLAIAEATVNGRPRQFILTSDRDEHIRISRGVPQAHIIENFCLGHRDFVTKLCIPPNTPDLLIAGNGEPSLRLFDWHKAVPKGVVNIGPSELCVVHDTGPNHSTELPMGRDFDKLAVSGIWPIDLPSSARPIGSILSPILVAIEGLPLLLLFILTSAGLTKIQTIELRGNILDVVVIPSNHNILVSIDNVHEPYSMKLYRSEENSHVPLFQVLELDTTQNWASSPQNLRLQIVDTTFGSQDLIEALPEAPEIVVEENLKGKTYDKIFSNLGEFLYGLENLRKKRDTIVEEEVVQEAEDGDIV